MRWLDSITDAVDMSLRKLWEIVKGRGAGTLQQSMGHKESDTTKQHKNNNTPSSEANSLKKIFSLENKIGVKPGKLGFGRYV